MKQAACVYIKNTQTGLVLLTTRRRKENEPISYGLPGGKSDPGETALETALRETMEETGVQLAPQQVTKVFTQVCEGDVDFETTCFYAEYTPTKIPGGIEDGIHALWGCHSDLIDRSVFADYHKELIRIISSNA